MTSTTQTAQWTVTFGCGEYLMTNDGTEIAYFETAGAARLETLGGHVVQRACHACRKHADEFHGCDCGARAKGRR